MRNYKRFSVSLVLWLFFIAGCASVPRAQSPLKTINNSQGGVIVYGLVEGATTEAAAMSRMLRSVHNSCGDRPQVGKLFKLRGTNSVAVFFTVVNHPQGNKPVAGYLFAAPSGPNQIDAALVSDDAARFGSTVNPMLNRLFSEWHPGGGGQASGPATGGRSALAARLHTVTASDNSASIGVPDGWTLNSGSGRGAIIVLGPQGAVVALNMHRDAVDPTSQWQRQYGGRPQLGVMIYPYHGNLMQAFPDMFQAWRRAGGKGPAKLQVEQIKPVQVVPQGMECVQVNGHMDPDGQGMKTMNTQMCATLPVSWGGYMVTLHQSLLANSPTEQENATWVAMISSWKLNMGVLDQQLEADKRRKAADDAAIRVQTQQAINNIKQIGANATARMNATQAANDAQHAGYWAQQDNNARSSQRFSNYLLDQTVIQDNNMHNNGTIGHGTVWNSTADALVKANPNRFEIVNSPNFWLGVDY